MPKKSAIFILTGVVASALFLALSWLRLNSMSRALDGLVLPEFLWGGYDVAYIERIQTAMTGELYESYATVHYVWDVLFPLTFAATLMMLIVQVAGRKAAMLLLLIVPLAYAGVEITENLLIEAMFATVPPSAELVAWASTFTVLKFVLFAACLVTALVTLLVRPKPEARGTSGVTAEA